MRKQQREGGGEAVVGNAIHAHFAVIVRDIFDEPFNAVVSVGGFAGGFRIAQVDLGAQRESAFGLESSAQVLSKKGACGPAPSRGRRTACGGRGSAAAAAGRPASRSPFAGARRRGRESSLPAR